MGGCFWVLDGCLANLRWGISSKCGRFFRAFCNRQLCTLWGSALPQIVLGKVFPLDRHVCVCPSLKWVCSFFLFGSGEVVYDAKRSNPPFFGLVFVTTHPLRRDLMSFELVRPNQPFVTMASGTQLFSGTLFPFVFCGCPTKNGLPQKGFLFFPGSLNN